ncbi:MAG: hypothetical protein J5J06_15750 [Phycisphaerae bacterium]|nr:hypothetical protein [Phycisphaerae bacterium]
MPPSPPAQESYSLENATQLLTRVDECIEELKRIAGVPPRLGFDGVWEWPYIGELNAERARLQTLDKELHEYLAASESEIDRLFRNRELIADHCARLHGRQAEDHYSEAEDQLNAEHREHVAMHSQIEQKIASAENALQDAVAPALPSSLPRPPVQQPCDPLLTSSPVTAPPHCLLPSGQTELDGLFEIDRLRM